VEPRPGAPRPPVPADSLDGVDDREAHAAVGAAPAPSPYSSLLGVGDDGEHLRRVRDSGTTPNGVFGAKLMWNQFGVVRQAISLWRALRGARWLATSQRSPC
jgi:hypothetical protein